jgi:hypothetical protein
MAIPKMYQPPSKDNATPATPSPSAKTARKDFVPACASKIPAQYKPKVADSPTAAAAATPSPAKKAPANFVPSCASKIPDQYKPKAAADEPVAAAPSPAKKAANDFVPACASKIPAQYKPTVARGAEAEADAAAAAGTPTKKVAPAGFVPRCATTPKKATDEAADAAAASPAPADAAATPKKTAPPGFVPRVAMAAKKTPSKAEAEAAAAAAAAAESEADTAAKPKRVASAGFFERLAGASTASRKAALDEAESSKTAAADAAASTADTAAPKRTANASTFDRLSATPTKAAAARRDAEASPATPAQAAAKPRAPRSDGPSIFDRLTDVKTFTGSHKERFTPDGKGKGLDGRDRPTIDPLGLRAKTRARAASSVSNDNADSPKRDGPSIFDRLTDVKTFTGSHKERFTPDGKGKGLDGRDRPTIDPLNLRTKAKTTAAAAAAASPSASESPSKREGPSIFDRLTDVKTFTGSHKERFDAEGKGKGLDGRDRPTVDPLNLRTKAKPAAAAATTPINSDPSKPSIFDRLNKQDTAAVKARHTADEKAAADAAAAAAATTSDTASPAAKSVAKPRDPNAPSIFDRLTQQTTAAAKARTTAIATAEEKVVDENGVDPEQAKRVMKKLHKIEPSSTPASPAAASTTAPAPATTTTTESIVVTNANGATSSATVVTEQLADNDAVSLAVAEQTSH